MTPEQTRRQEMIDYLNTLKMACQQHALNEISRHGSEEYAQHEMDKAKMVGEIVELVETAYDFKTGHASANELRSAVGLEPIDTETGLSYILHTKGGKYPSMIAFKSSEEAEAFVNKNNLKNCSLTCVQYGKKEWYE